MNRSRRLLQMAKLSAADSAIVSTLEIPKYETTKGLDAHERAIILTAGEC